MNEEDGLLAQAAARLRNRGYVDCGMINDEIEGLGTNRIVFKRDGELFHPRAKEYVYRGTAPFGKQHVLRAATDGAWLVIFFADLAEKHGHDPFWVFDPEYVRDEGSQTSGRSKRSERRSWLEVPLDAGVTLEHFEEGSRPWDAVSADPSPQEYADEWANTALTDFTDND